MKYKSPRHVTKRATMVRTKDAKNPSSTARPSVAAASVSEDQHSVHEVFTYSISMLLLKLYPVFVTWLKDHAQNTFTIVPITSPSNPLKPGLRGTYRIPSTLYNSLSKFLDPNVCVPNLPPLPSTVYILPIMRPRSAFNVTLTN